MKMLDFYLKEQCDGRKPFNAYKYPVHYPTRDLLRTLGLLKQGVKNELHYCINYLNAENVPAQW